jgi:hypothetical protein
MWSGVRSVREIDAFVRRYAAPLLREAGYRHRGRKFMIDGPRGRQAIIHWDPMVDADRTALELSYGVTTPAHRQFRESRGIPDEAWPYANYALVNSRLFSPEFARTGVPGPVLPAMWVLGDADHTARVGAAFAEGLVRDVLPQIREWFEPEATVRVVVSPPSRVGVGLASGPRAEAIALLDVDGAGARLRQTLDRLPADDMVRVWIEARLAKGLSPFQ